jgi:hypothetical protein
MPRAMTPLQQRVMDQITEGPKTVTQISEALGSPDNSVCSILYKFRDEYECAHVCGHVNSPHKRANLWVAGKGESKVYPNKKTKKLEPALSLAKTEARGELRELSKKKAEVHAYIAKHLQKQNTQFGWLLENAHGNDARG